MAALKSGLFSVDGLVLALITGESKICFFFFFFFLSLGERQAHFENEQRSQTSIRWGSTGMKTPIFSDISLSMRTQ